MNRSLYYFLFNFVFCTFLQAADSAQFKTFKKDVAVGSTLGMAEVVLQGQPLTAVKNALQSGRKVPTTFAQLSRGLSANVLGMVPTTGAQLGAKGLLSHVHAQDGKALSDKQELAVAAESGVAGSAVAAPVELAVARSQLKEYQGKKMRYVVHDVVRTYGMRGLATAMPATALRDAGFTEGYMVFGPKARGWLYEKTGSNVIATVGTAVGVGVPVAAATHPFDTVATRQRNDPTKTLLMAFKEGNLYRGFTPRAIRVSGALTLFTYGDKAVRKYMN